MDVPKSALPDLLIARQKRGVSLEEIAASTKITISYLRAIEEGTFERLPGGIYTVSYIRQYARAIDYDEDELVRRYYRLTGTEPPKPPPGMPSAKGSSGGALERLARVLS